MLTTNNIHNEIDYTFSLIRSLHFLKNLNKIVEGFRRSGRFPLISAVDAEIQ